MLLISISGVGGTIDERVSLFRTILVVAIPRMIIRGIMLSIGSAHSSKMAFSPS
jgi:hypothetical protein